MLFPLEKPGIGRLLDLAFGIQSWVLLPFHGRLKMSDFQFPQISEREGFFAYGRWSFLSTRPTSCIDRGLIALEAPKINPPRSHLTSSYISGKGVIMISFIGLSSTCRCQQREEQTVQKQMESTCDHQATDTFFTSKSRVTPTLKQTRSPTGLERGTLR